jgi:hypothetical protein
MFIELEDIVFTIIFTLVYTLISSYMSFRLNDILDKEPTVEKLTRHFLVWPIEILFILILSIKIYIKEKYINTK